MRHKKNKNRFCICTVTNSHNEVSNIYLSSVSINGSFIGSIGVNYAILEVLFLRVNLAKAYHTPNLAEMTSNGHHEIRYEVGNPNLVSEKSHETDLSMYLHRENLSFDNKSKALKSNDLSAFI